MRPRYEVADIFRLYGKQYRKTHAMSGGTTKGHGCNHGLPDSKARWTSRGLRSLRQYQELL